MMIFFILAPTLKSGAISRLDAFLANKKINGKKIDIIVHQVMMALSMKNT